MNIWFQIALKRGVSVRAIKTSVYVGTLLVIINQGSLIIRQGFTPEICVKILLTYILPYCVSTCASVGAIRKSYHEHDNVQDSPGSSFVV